MACENSTTNACIQYCTVRSAWVRVRSFLAPDRLRPCIRRSFSVRGHDGHKIVLKSLKPSPINYCKGQRGQSSAWKPAKSHQSAVRVTSVSGTPLFSLSARFLSLLSNTPPPSLPAIHLYRVLSCFLANEVPPPQLNPNILKFMSKCYVAHISTQGLLKHPGFSWHHFQCRFNAHFGHEIQIFCLRKWALHILNCHGDFHSTVEIQAGTFRLPFWKNLRILEFIPSSILQSDLPYFSLSDSYNLFIYYPNSQNIP